MADAHDHSHDHAHETDTYYLDQLCMIALTGAFAGICLTMYFLNTDMLRILLKEDFYPFILGAGITLLLVTLVRAAILWREAGKKPAHSHQHHDHSHHHHDHNHAHDHDHSHDHGDSHDHDHEHDHGQHHHHHDHDHEHAHDHAHHHHDHDHEHHHHHPHADPALAPAPDHHYDQGHGDDGHDHGWAPWRYVLLLIPLTLYLLGLPNKALPIGGGSEVDTSRDVVKLAQVVALGPLPLGQAVLAAGAQVEPGVKIADVYLDGHLSNVAALKPEMKIAVELVADRQVVGNKGAKAIWAGDAPVPAQGTWTPGVIKAVDPVENTLTVLFDKGSEETLDLEAPIFVPFKKLEQLARSDVDRQEYNGKKVQVVGQFAPSGNPRVFSLARLQIQCCGADAVQLNVPIVCREAVRGFKKEDWVRVTGRIEFRQQQGRQGVYMTVLVVNRVANIVPTQAETNDPYLR
jgi:uncharacterized membrane protein YcgQ (UPF0703/DUF1980 family)